MKKYKIALTGGHGGTTALATIESLQKQQGLSLIWAGPKYAHEGENALTYEFRTFPRLEIDCFSIRAGRLQRKLTAHTFSSLFKIPLGVMDSFWFLWKQKPDLVISFGGFAAFPVCLMAWFFGKPLVIHEQTTGAGLANRLSAPFANKIALARSQSLKYFPKEKSVVLGNPLRRAILKAQPPTHLLKLPTIYITGGSRGSRWINDALEPILPELTKQFKLVHQTGTLEFEKFKLLRESLPQKSHYQCFDFIKANKLQEVLSQTNIMVSRAGANTVAEIMALQIPSVLIPIPWVQKDEQTKNAKLVKKAGFGLILPQEDLSAQTLREAILDLRKNWAELKAKAALYKSEDKEASTKLAQLVVKILYA